MSVVHGAVRCESWPPLDPFYRLQLGVSAGVNLIGAPLADFPGSHWGVDARVGKHSFGFRQEWDGEFMKIFGEPVYYKRRGVFYGWSDVQRNFQWGPQAGLGMIEFNKQLENGDHKQYDGIYGELTMHFLLNYRANGIGMKAFVNFNQYTVFVGGTLYLHAGFAFNCKGRSAVGSQ